MFPNQPESSISISGLKNIAVKTGMFLKNLFYQESLWEKVKSVAIIWLLISGGLFGIKEAYRPERSNKRLCGAGLGPWNDNAVMEYLGALNWDEWQCQMGMVLGTIGTLMTENPLLLGIGAINCLEGVGAINKVPEVLGHFEDVSINPGERLNLGLQTREIFRDDPTDVLALSFEQGNDSPLPSWMNCSHSLEIAGTCEMSIYPFNLVLSDEGKAYVAPGVEVVDITDTSNPYILWKWNFNDSFIFNH